MNEQKITEIIYKNSHDCGEGLIINFENIQKVIGLLSGWIDANKLTPELIKDEDYSENVLAVCNGQLSVMCYCYIPGEDGGYVWANCNNRIDGDAEFDDNYEVTHWQSFPSLPKLETVAV